MKSNEFKRTVLCTALALACLGLRANPPPAVEVKNMCRTILKIFGKEVKTNVGWEIHLTQGEVHDFGRAAPAIAAAIKHPVAAATVLGSAALIKSVTKARGSSWNCSTRGNSLACALDEQDFHPGAVAQSLPGFQSGPTHFIFPILRLLFENFFQKSDIQSHLIRLGPHGLFAGMPRFVGG